MKTTKWVEMTSKREVTDRFFCDWCGKDIVFDERYDDKEFTLKYLVSTSGEDFFIVRDESWKADLCPDCIDKLKSFLIENGANLQKGEDPYL